MKNCGGPGASEALMDERLAKHEGLARAGKCGEGELSTAQRPSASARAFDPFRIFEPLPPRSPFQASWRSRRPPTPPVPSRERTVRSIGPQLFDGLVDAGRALTLRPKQRAQTKALSPPPKNET